MDARIMEFEDNQFDFVIDKGCFDSIMVFFDFTKCGESCKFALNKMLKEVLRVLKPNGKFILISRGTKDSRFPFLQNPELSFDIKTFPLKKSYFNGAIETQSSEKSIAQNVTLYECTKVSLKFHED